MCMMGKNKIGIATMMTVMRKERMVSNKRPMKQSLYNQHCVYIFVYCEYIM